MKKTPENEGNMWKTHGKLRKTMELGKLRILVLGSLCESTLAMENPTETGSFNPNITYKKMSFNLGFYDDIKCGGSSHRSWVVQ